MARRKKRPGLDIWCTCRRAFGPADGERWRSYVDWSGLVQLDELLSLDGMMCPDVIDSLTEDDWRFNVQEDFHIYFFYDLKYLLERTSSVAEPKNVLAVCREPISEASALLNDAHFEFKGYDLLDQDAAISALSNCGGFELAFANADLSRDGLIKDYAAAQSVNAKLNEFYPEEHHADTNVWAVWKLMA